MKFGTWWAVLTVGFALLMTPQTSAAQAPQAIWESNYQTCLAEKPGQNYSCACETTARMDQCKLANGATLTDCLKDVPGSKFAERCKDVGYLTNGGRVKPGTPVPSSEGYGPRMTRLERWRGSVLGCLSQATPAERARATSMAYTCACFATYFLNICAPTDETTNLQVAECAQARMPSLLPIVPQCDHYGSLTTRGG